MSNVIESTSNSAWSSCNITETFSIPVSATDSTTSGSITACTTSASSSDGNNTDVISICHGTTYESSESVTDSSGHNICDMVIATSGMNVTQSSSAPCVASNPATKASGSFFDLSPNTCVCFINGTNHECVCLDTTCEAIDNTDRCVRSLTNIAEVNRSTFSYVNENSLTECSSVYSCTNVKATCTTCDTDATKSGFGAAGNSNYTDFQPLSLTCTRKEITETDLSFVDDLDHLEVVDLVNPDEIFFGLFWT